MVVLRRVCEDAHTRKLEGILKLFSRDPDNWREEWSVNPEYMVDLRQYGAGHCMCGHAIRYQYQFVNNINKKTLPVGRVCVRQLNLAKYDVVLSRLENMAKMAEVDVDPSLPPREFVRKYKQTFSPDKIQSLIDYKKLNDDSDYKKYSRLYDSATNTQRDLAFMRDYILKVQDIDSKFVDSIEKKSKPVTTRQISVLDNELARKMANARQLSLF